MCGAIFEKVRARNAVEDSMFAEVERLDQSPYAASAAPHSVPLWMKVGLVAVLVVVGALAAYTRFKPAKPPAGFT